MSRILTLGAVDSFENEKIQSRIYKLGIKINVADVLDVAAEEHGEVIALTDAIKNTSVNISIVSKRFGNKTLANNVSLMAMLEHSAWGEGSFLINDDYMQGDIEIGVNGAISLTGSDYLVVSMNCSDAGIIQGWEVSVLDHDEDTDSVHDWTKITLETNDENDYNLIGVKELLLPVAALAVDSIEITSNKRTVKCSQDELQIEARSENDYVSVGYTSQFGFGTYVTKDVEDKIALKVYSGDNGLGNAMYMVQPLKVA